MASADDNNIKLTDSTGTLRQPFLSITLSITNTRVDDVIEVFLESGTTQLPNKAQFTSHNTNNAQSDVTFELITGSFPNDTPSAGSFTVIDSGANEEHRYRYSSFSSGTLTLGTGVNGTADSTVDTFTLTDTGVFIVANTKRGDIIRRTNGAGGFAFIISRDSDNQVTTTRLSLGAGWVSGDTFETNELVVTYEDKDTFFVPYLSAVEDTGTDGTPGSASSALTFVVNREVVIEIRNVEASTKIKPFKTTGTMTNTGLIQSVIRTTDTVAT